MERQKKRKPAKAVHREPKRLKAQAGLKKQATDIDALQWKTVEVPEMFDDAEGFFGMEEVEGVDVVRDGEKVHFLAALPSNTIPVELSGSDVEFSGFDDLPRESGATNQIDSNKTVTETAKSTQTKEKTTAEDSKGAEGSVGDRAFTEPEDTELEVDLFSRLHHVDRQGESDEEADVSAWNPMNLSPHIRSCVSRLKFSKPTAIQSRAIPAILDGHDVVGKAATGSGKTLAFGIPIVERWIQMNESDNGKDGKKSSIALILSPTRELAHQITNHIKNLCAGLDTAPRVCSVTGGLSVYKQQRQLEKADIVIGTPGRLWEVMRSSSAYLSSFRGISFLVVDEADRLLTEGHFKEVEDILKALERAEKQDGDGSDGDAEPERHRQTLVFSATFDKGLQQKLAGKRRFRLQGDEHSMGYLLEKLNFRERPTFVDVNPVSQMAEKLREGLIECGAMEKDLYLYAVLLLQATRRTLVFTNSISSVRRLTPLLQNLAINALPLHSGMAQKARLRSIERFTGNKIVSKEGPTVLVATDVASRGLDIPGIDMIIHYHVPRAADAYVHRSGRTARAGSSGVSVLLCAPDEVVPTRRLVAKVHAAAEKRADRPVRIKHGSTGGFFVRTIDIDRRIVSRLRERVVLAKKVADANLAKEKGRKDDDWMKTAAEDLGVEYDSDELEDICKWSGRGSERQKTQKEARNATKAELGALRAMLKQLLSTRVNTGVSEKYLDGLDVDELLRGSNSGFLGRVDGLGLDV